MIAIWKHEFDRYIRFDLEHKVVWLSRLLFLISMFARDTYEPGTVYVEKPIELRRFNELLHRIASQQLDIALDEPERMPDEQFFTMISEEIEQLDVDAGDLIGLLRERD